MEQINWPKAIGKTIAKISHHKDCDGEQLQIVFETGDFIVISTETETFVECNLIDEPLRVDKWTTK